MAKIINVLRSFDGERTLVVYANGSARNYKVTPQTAIVWASSIDRNKDRLFKVEYCDDNEPDAFCILHATDETVAWASAEALVDGRTILELYEIDPNTYDPICNQETTEETAEEEATEEATEETVEEVSEESSEVSEESSEVSEKVSEEEVSEDTTEEVTYPAVIRFELVRTADGWNIVKCLSNGDRLAVWGGDEYDKALVCLRALADDYGVDGIVDEDAIPEATSETESQAETEWVEAVDEDDVERATFYMVATHPESVSAPAPASQLSAVATTTDSTEGTKAETQRERIDWYETACNACKAAVAVAGAVAGMAVSAGCAAVRLGKASMILWKALANVLFAILMVLTDAYYWVTTWVPIGARRAVSWGRWTAAPAFVEALIAVVGYAITALVALKTIVVAAAGWIMVGCIAIIGALAHAWAALVDGWNFRNEIIEETRETA